MKQKILQAMVVLLACLGAHAQVNSGSNGSDGAFHPTTNTVINMADHPTGIYHYTSVNIPSGVTVTFIRNANNTPVVWLVQSNVVINGHVLVNGLPGSSSSYGQGGPGGFSGGSGGIGAMAGQGPGGGGSGVSIGANASYGTLGYTNSDFAAAHFIAAGSIYGNDYLIPLIGGSGGGGFSGGGGGGGGGAILIAASNTITVNGVIDASSGAGYWVPFYGGSGAGSGGAVRLIATKITGNSSGAVVAYSNGSGNGRVRFDTYEMSFGGNVGGVFSQGSQFVIIPTAGQGAQLTVTSVGGVLVSASPSGQLATPDAVLSAQQNNPISIVVHCSNIPLNTQITVSVKPANGATVSATGLNNAGTLASSTATVLLNMPRGGGIIYATAAN